MRVGLVIYGDLNTVSGGYLYDRCLVEHLLQSGDQVEVFSIPWRSYGRHLSDNIDAALYRRLLAADIDVLLQDELNHPSLTLINRRLRGRVSYSIVSIVHHLRCSEERPNWQNRLYSLVERAYLRSIDGAVHNSQTTRQTVDRLVGYSVPSVVAYPAGDRLGFTLADAEIKARALSKGPLRIAFVGNVIPRKGLHVLLNAVSQLQYDQWRLSVVGDLETDRQYVASIRRQVEELGLSGHVQFFGALQDHDLIHRLSHRDVLAVPSSYEGFGIVYLEGMAFGLPSIATTAGAAREVVTDGQDGFLVEPGDERAIAVRIQRLSADRDRLLRMSFAARCRYSSHPTWRQSMTSVRAFLQSMQRTG